MQYEETVTIASHVHVPVVNLEMYVIAIHRYYVAEELAEELAGNRSITSISTPYR